jgi:NADH-quinone oxidoreductase subunit M
MFQFPSILLSLITLPLLTILVILMIPERRTDLIKSLSLWTSIIVFLLSLFLWLGFDLSTSKYQFVEPFFFSSLF